MSVCMHFFAKESRALIKVRCFLARLHFFWLLSLLLSSLVCSIPSLIEITWLVAVLSVLIQEGFRYLFVKLYFYTFEKVKFKLAGTRDILPLNDLSAAIASGVGTGTIYTLIMYGQVGSYTLTEPGTIYNIICGRNH